MTSKIDRKRRVETSEIPIEAAVTALAGKKVLEPKPRTDRWFRERRAELKRQADEALQRRFNTNGNARSVST